MYGWPLIVLGLFMMVKPRKAVLLAYFGGVMFLPMEASQSIPLLYYNKINATSIGVLLGILIIDQDKLRSYRFHLYDIPIFIWVFSGMITSLVNGLGVYDGMYTVCDETLTWGIPYFAGRLYFSDEDGLYALLRAMIIAGIVYIPFILYEIRMSPQSHRILWGFHQHAFIQTIRWGGWRPMVFMQHGLMVGMWIAMAALASIGSLMYSKNIIKQIWGIPNSVIAFVLFGIAVLCKSLMSLGWCIFGIGVLISTKRFKASIILWILVLTPPTYMILRGSGLWDGQNAVDFITETINADRAQSLAGRFDDENIILEKVFEHPFFGWGRWGRTNYQEKDTRHRKIDGFWVITFGQKGVVGLFSTMLIMLLPLILLVVKLPIRYYEKPEYAPAFILSLIVALFMMDCLLNYMMNPVYILFSGSVIGFMAIRHPFLVKTGTQIGSISHEPSLRLEPEKGYNYFSFGMKRPVKDCLVGDIPSQKSKS